MNSITAKPNDVESLVLSDHSAKTMISALLSAMPAELHTLFIDSYDATGEPSSIIEIADVADMIQKGRYRIRKRWSVATKKIVHEWFDANDLQGPSRTALTNAERQKRYRQKRRASTLAAVQAQPALIARLKDRLLDRQRSLRAKNVKLSLGTILLGDMRPDADLFTVAALLQLVEGPRETWPQDLRDAWAAWSRHMYTEVRARVAVDQLLNQRG